MEAYIRKLVQDEIISYLMQEKDDPEAKQLSYEKSLYFISLHQKSINNIINNIINENLICGKFIMPNIYEYIYSNEKFYEIMISACY